MKAKMFRALLPIAIVFTMISCSTSETEDAAAPIVENFSYTDVELDLMSKINEHRASVGLNTLQPINQNKSCNRKKILHQHFYEKVILPRIYLNLRRTIRYRVVFFMVNL